MKTLADIFLHPRRAAEAFREVPSIPLPAAIVMAAALLLFAAGYAAAAAGTAAHIPPTASPEARRAVEEYLRGEFFRNCSFLPFRLLAGWTLFASALWISARAVCAPRGIRFVHFFSLVIHAEAIPVAAGILSVAHLTPPGLSLLDPGGSSFWTSLLTSVNLVTLWHVLVLSIGTSVLCRSRFRTAALAAGVVWGGSLALHAGILALCSRLFSFPI